MPDLDPFDALLREASRHGIRVLLTLQPPTGSHDLSGLARFWLNRGVAGLHIASPSAASPSEASPAATSPAPANPDGLQDLVQSVRKQEEGALGQRILISDTGLAEQESDALPAHPSARRQSAAHSPAATQLQIDTQASRLADPAAATLRPLLAASLTRPGLLLDLRAPGTANGRPLANSFAAIALTTHPAALIDDAANLVLQPTPEHVEQPDEPAKPIPPPPPPPPPGTYLPYVPYVPPAKPATVAAPKPPPPDPLTTWYGKLAALHHDSAVLRNGTTTFLDFDAQNTLVWVTRLPSQSPLTPPVVVVCNLSDAPVRLSLAAAMTKLNLHGAFLRTLLRTDTAMGGQDLDSVNVPAFAVYIGELRR
jgi:alpha-glucosidase